MIRIKIEEIALKKAQEDHVSAIVNYVKGKNTAFQKNLFAKIAQIIACEQDFEDLSVTDNWMWLHSFLLASVDQMRIWVKEKSDLLKFDEFLKLYSSQFCNGATKYVSNDYNAYVFLKNIGVKVCPYCEEEYLDLLTKDNGQQVRTMEIDHFFPKSSYPGLAMCFYNLIPSGQVCNGIKLADDLGMSPYDEDIEDHTHLAVDLPIGTNMNDVSEDECEILFHATGKMITNVRLLVLEKRYEKYKGRVHRYLTLMQQFPLEKIEMLVEQGWFDDKEQAYRILYNETLNSAKERPELLQKLKRDILGNEIMMYLE